MRSHMQLDTLNLTDCADLIKNVSWFDINSLILLTVLILIDILVITGNVLVIIAIFSSSLLRSVTNFFIISLAFADLMVGISVLPFSATWETYKIWIFGDLVCSFWLAIDVWMCTASILHLCAISLDRYLAVTRPVTYPSLMTAHRAKMLIAFLWILSFVICFPPLIGWRDDFPKRAEDVFLNTSALYKSNQTLINLSNSNCQWKCELTNEVGYVVYSALGSFYIPMFVMLFFYWKIYRAAIQTTRAINQGFRTTKGMGTRTEAQRLTLRIHKGRKSDQGSSPLLISNHNCDSLTSSITDNNYSPQLKTEHSSLENKEPITHDIIKISVNFPSNEDIKNETRMLKTIPSSNSLNPDYVAENSMDNKMSLMQRFSLTSQSDNSSLKKSQISNSAYLKKKMARKKTLKAHVKTFRTETKAAKTLGIIVGGFILCWLPFFTMYLIRAFYPNIINPLVFSILFWLGYCNSALNPLIYALFSKDFRNEFQKILYKLFCCKKLNRDVKLTINYQLAKKIPASRSNSNFSNLPDNNNIELKEFEKSKGAKTR